MKVFSIESSCDDTSFAIVNSDKKILFLKTINHSKFHSNHGGVVPEIAARQHLDVIGILSKQLIKKNLKEIDAVACTCGPGLIGGVIVGSSFAKGLAINLKKKFLPINHLQAHLLSPRLVSNITYPYLSLLVSGGNTALVLVKNPKNFVNLGSTIDDSAGECFDKVAKSLNLQYPGGPAIESMAIKGNNYAYVLPRPLCNLKSCNFSFSGLKTASINVINKNKLSKSFVRDFSASFQYTVGEILINRISNALEYLESKKIYIKNFSLCGGVAANKYLNALMRNFIYKKKIDYYQVPMELCTDNAAMIGWNAIEILNFTKRKFFDYGIKPSPNTLIHESF